MTRSEKVGCAACASIAIFVLIVYAGLIPGGHWQDEYITLRYVHDGGIQSVIQRIRGWSPRPLSEVLVYLYSKAVYGFNRPLVGAALGITWVITGLMTLAVPTFAGAKSRIVIFVSAASLSALYLLDHATGELFYWPIASIAYLPGLGAITAVFWLAALNGLETRASRWAAAILLIIAAASVEIGALFVVSFAVIMLVSFAVARHRFDRREVTWLAAPVVLSLSVLALLATGRVSYGKEILGNAAIVHHFWKVPGVSTLQFFKEAIVPDTTRRAFGLPAKILVFLAFYGIIPSIGARKANSLRLYTVLSIAFVATAYLTVAASFYQFGMPGCERHFTFRQCLIYLSLISAAGAFGIRYQPEPAKNLSKYFTFLALALLISLAPSVPPLHHDYARLKQLEMIRAENWKSGRKPGSSMTFEQMRGKIVGDDIVTDGTYSYQAHRNSTVDWVMYFFHKKTVTFKTVK